MLSICLYETSLKRTTLHSFRFKCYRECFWASIKPRKCVSDKVDSGTLQYMIAVNLTHWGRVTHICVSKLTIIGSDNGLSPDRRQAIIWTNAELLLIGPWGTNFSEIVIEILTFSFKKIRLKVPSAKQRPFCIGGLNVLKNIYDNCISGCDPLEKAVISGIFGGGILVTKWWPPEPQYASSELVGVPRSD